LDQLLAGLGARDLAGFWFDDDHWHPFATRRATRQICFGDSVYEARWISGDRRPLEVCVQLKQTLTWLFDRFPIDNAIQAQFDIVPIRTSAQKLTQDSISCGLFGLGRLEGVSGAAAGC
jgi:hypothetical protein